MIGYTNKDIDAVAMLRPVPTIRADRQHEEIQRLVAKAHVERSIFIGGLIRKVFDGETGYIKVVAGYLLRFMQKMAAEYTASRDALKAADKLFAMTPRQLEDLGLSYRDIDAAVYGRGKKRSTLIAGLGAWIKDLPGRFAQWQKDRAGNAELMALDDRALADIGICRGEIASVSKYGREAAKARANDNANDNMSTKAANDDHREAV